MVDSRKKGVTSREIEGLTDGRWKESTVRGYIRGVSPGSEWKGHSRFAEGIYFFGIYG